MKKRICEETRGDRVSDRRGERVKAVEQEEGRAVIER